jgi:hypothetical protein
MQENYPESFDFLVWGYIFEMKIIPKGDFSRFRDFPTSAIIRLWKYGIMKMRGVQSQKFICAL